MNPDISTAASIAEVINDEIGQDVAFLRDSGTVLVKIPGDFKGSVANFIALFEKLKVEPDQPAADAGVDHDVARPVVGMRVHAPAAGGTIGATLQLLRFQRRRLG